MHTTEASYKVKKQTHSANHGTNIWNSKISPFAIEFKVKHRAPNKNRKLESVRAHAHLRENKTKKKVKSKHAQKMNNMHNRGARIRNKKKAASQSASGGPKRARGARAKIFAKISDCGFIREALSERSEYQFWRFPIGAPLKCCVVYYIASFFHSVCVLRWHAPDSFSFFLFCITLSCL